MLPVATDSAVKVRNAPTATDLLASGAEVHDTFRKSLASYTTLAPVRYCANRCVASPCLVSIMGVSHNEGPFRRMVSFW